MNQERMYQVLQAPLVSEKSSNLADQQNQVIFKVARDASKEEIKRAVETLFDVNVLQVTTCQVKPKSKSFRGRPGQRKGWKKAYLSLAEGQEINFLDGVTAQ